jgi:hypothetical protein
MLKSDSEFPILFITKKNMADLIKTKQKIELILDPEYVCFEAELVSLSCKRLSEDLQHTANIGGIGFSLQYPIVLNLNLKSDIIPSEKDVIEKISSVLNKTNLPQEAV